MRFLPPSSSSTAKPMSTCHYSVISSKREGGRGDRQSERGAGGPVSKTFWCQILQHGELWIYRRSSIHTKGAKPGLKGGFGSLQNEADEKQLILVDILRGQRLNINCSSRRRRRGGGTSLGEEEKQRTISQRHARRTQYPGRGGRDLRRRGRRVPVLLHAQTTSTP